MNDLLLLASRVEALIAPDRDVDLAIYHACGYEGGAIPADPYVFIRPIVPAYTRLIDAAMLLVPEECSAMLFRFGGNGSGEAQVGSGKAYKAATPALALLAAALRARTPIRPCRGGIVAPIRAVSRTAPSSPRIFISSRA